MSRKMEEKGSVIRQRLGRLRLAMEENGIDAYLVETADFHQSEYVGDYFKSRAYLSGFTGSAGTLLVDRKEAALWTDGRYFVQAAGQLEGTGIRLMRSGQEGVPTVLEFLEQNLPQGSTLGFDGRTVSGAWWEKARERLGRKQIKLEGNLDLAGQVWEDRPPLLARPVWILDEKYAGKSAAEKLKELRHQMMKEGADVHILTSLDDIAWLLNIRGGNCLATFDEDLTLLAEIPARQAFGITATDTQVYLLCPNAVESYTYGGVQHWARQDLEAHPLAVLDADRTLVFVGSLVEELTPPEE